MMLLGNLNNLTYISGFDLRVFAMTAVERCAHKARHSLMKKDFVTALLAVTHLETQAY